MELGAGAESFGFTGTLDSYQLLTEQHTGQCTDCAWLGSVTVAYDWAVPSMDTQMAHHHRANSEQGRQRRPLGQQGYLVRRHPDVVRPSF